MKNQQTLLLAGFIAGANSFPFVANLPGVDTSLLRRQAASSLPGSQSQCAYNPNHVPAAPITAQWPYNNASNGIPGNGKGGFLVPDPDDKAHAFVAPDYSKDIRGPCPGLNTAANHNFLAHDGITTFNELVDAQQNVYNVGYDLAVLLAVLGLTTTDGDIVTEKLSIGCDATNRTSSAPALIDNGGLDAHNKFEADTSLTRNDYFTHGGDNFRFNGTLFGMMTETTGGNYDLQNLALYRAQRYNQSIVENPNFYYGPLSLLLYGAASFLYELMPSGTRNYAPDFYTISSFFGAESDGNGGYVFNGQEKIPDNWTNRVEPYTDFDVGAQIFEMYGLYPVAFGGNTGPDAFNGNVNFGDIQNGKIPSGTTANDFTCLLYMLATERVPTSLDTVLELPLDVYNFAVGKLAPRMKNLGCPIPLEPSSSK